MASYSVVYSSKTGNTKQLAEAICEALPAKDRLYFGNPPAAAVNGIVFAGFWTDKGECDGEMARFLETLRGERIFLFGTAGFGESAEYFERILSAVRGRLDSSCTVIGQFMCQGKMPPSVRKRYEGMLPEDPERAKMLLANFDKASSHPDDSDRKRAAQAAREALER